MRFRKDLINPRAAQDEILRQHIHKETEILRILYNRGDFVHHSQVYSEQFMKDYASDRLLVLVIEEKLDILQKVTSALALGNHATCCCTSAATALAAAEESPPDLIISATSLNGASGLELCDRIKQHPGLEAVPVMFLSGGQIPDIIRRHDPGGGAYYIRKPFDSNVLLQLVDKTLQTPAMAGR